MPELDQKPTLESTSASGAATESALAPQTVREAARGQVLYHKPTFNPSGQDVATLLGILSGGMPNLAHRRVDREVTSLLALTEFFNAVVRNESDAYERFFPDDVLERAQSWAEQACHRLGRTGSPLGIEGVRNYLRFACVPAAVAKIADLFEHQITRNEVSQYSEEELDARAELCLALLGYTGKGVGQCLETMDFIKAHGELFE